MPSGPFLLCLQPHILHTRWAPQASVTSHPDCPQMSSPPWPLPAPRSLQVLRGSPAFHHPQPCLPPTCPPPPVLVTCSASVPALSPPAPASVSAQASWSPCLSQHPHHPHWLPEVLLKCSSDLPDPLLDVLSGFSSPQPDAWARLGDPLPPPRVPFSLWIATPCTF